MLAFHFVNNFPCVMFNVQSSMFNSFFTATLGGKIFLTREIIFLGYTKKSGLYGPLLLCQESSKIINDSRCYHYGAEARWLSGKMTGICWFNMYLICT